MKRVILIDGNALMHRSFHAVKFAPQYEGMSVGMVFGFASTLLQTLEKFVPDYLLLAFDTKEKTFRHDLFPEYKAQREKAPDEFYAQIPLVHSLAESFQIKILSLPGYEADDVIGTMARQAENKEWEVFILSGDLDFLQLISPHIYLAKFNGSEPLIYDRAQTYEKLSIYPEQIVDYKAICGDASDNYKGIPGVGHKTAVRLLSEYKTLDNVYKNLEILPEKLRHKFELAKDLAFECQELARIDCAVPIPFVLDCLDQYVLPLDRVREFFIDIKFPALLKRAEKLNKNSIQNNNFDQKNNSNSYNKSEQISLF